jgi:hypothetical protein
MGVWTRRVRLADASSPPNIVALLEGLTGRQLAGNVGVHKESFN